MALTDIINNVAGECGYAVVPSNMTTATDVTTNQLLKMANRIIKEMAEEYCWPKLRKTGTFTLEDGEDTYALPADFSYYHYETFWNQSDRWPLYGPLTSQQYAERIGYGFGSLPFHEFTVRGVTDKEITLLEEPDADSDGKIIIYEYSAARPVKPRTYAIGQSYTSGQYTFYNGIYYLAGSSGTTVGASPAVDSGVTWAVYLGKYESFLHDTDEPVLSERILEQGVLERFAKVKKLECEILFASQLSDEYAKLANGKVLFAGGPSLTRFQTARSGVVGFGSRV